MIALCKKHELSNSLYTKEDPLAQPNNNTCQFSLKHRAQLFEGQFISANPGLNFNPCFFSFC